VGYGAYTGGGIRVDLRDDEIIYIRPNPSTATPFGLGPLEVALRRSHASWASVNLPET
jgi:hypothetical protein